MGSHPTDPRPANWDAYRLSIASVQEQEAAAQVESLHQAAIAQPRKRIIRTEAQQDG